MNPLALGLTAWLLAAEPPVSSDTQDFVFLAEARPVLVRVQVRIDGRPLRAAQDDFLKHLFAHLDVDGDGVLNKDEVERVPTPNQVLNGGFRAFIGASAAPKRETLDADKDGKVTLVELSAYYRTNGFAPFQFQLNPNDSAARAQLAYLGGARPDPEVAAVSKAIFARLDANKDGKLSAEELAAAPDVLLRMDENEDEIITAAELVPDAKPPSPTAMMAARAKPGSSGETILVPIPTPNRPPAELAKHMQQRYGGGKKEKKLDRKELGLDETTFARLDADKDGGLDADELLGFARRSPDLCLTVHFGTKDKAKEPIELLAVDGQMPALAGKVQKREDLLLLDLGATRAEIHRRAEENGTGRIGDFVRPQLIAQFRAADANGDGCLDAAEVKKSRFFGGIFKAMDRDNDGKVTEKEFLAYLDKAQDLHKRAAAACVTLVLRDQSRGLFSLLDNDGDGRLSVREMRQASKLLPQFDPQGRGYLRPEDLPHIHRLTLRRGSANAENDQEALFLQRYFDNYREETPAARGPAWFRKMDRNRDGDVSRREFLFSDEQFRRIDTDGDGLISVEEAAKAGVPSSGETDGSNGSKGK